MPQSEKQRVLLVGHSHLGVWGVHRARVHVPADAPEFALKRISDTPRVIDGLSCLLPEQPGNGLLGGIKAFAAGRTLVMLWRGGYHVARFIVIEQPGFDFILSDEPQLGFDPNARLVPETLVEAALKPAADDLWHWLSAIAQLGPGGPDRIIVAATPPPKGDSAFVAARLEGELGQGAVDKLNNGNNQYGLCSPATLCKVWKLLMRGYKNVAERLGAEFLPVPPDCQDANGCLRQVFYGRDVTHANEAWGELFLRHLNGYLDRTEWSS